MCVKPLIIDMQYKDIRAVLARNPKGMKVLPEYERHGTLAPESRQVLVRIAVGQLVEDCGM